MADLLLYTRNDHGGRADRYRRGDVVCAMNRRRIRATHAEHLCHPSKAARSASGLILPGQLSEHWYARTHRYRFDRVSQTEVLRTDLALGSADVLGPTPNASGESMDVPMFLARRLRQEGSPIFGQPGRESWYGVALPLDHVRLDLVWAAIEEHSDRREADHQEWPWTPRERSAFLPMAAEDFDDARADELVSSETEEGTDERGRRVETVLQRRLHSVDYRALLSAADRSRAEDEGQAFRATAPKIDVTSVAHVTRRQALKGGGRG